MDFYPDAFKFLSHLVVDEVHRLVEKDALINLADIWGSLEYYPTTTLVSATLSTKVQEIADIIFKEDPPFVIDINHGIKMPPNIQHWSFQVEESQINEQFEVIVGYLSVNRGVIFVKNNQRVEEVTNYLNGLNDPKFEAVPLPSGIDPKRGIALVHLYDKQKIPFLVTTSDHVLDLQTPEYQG